ncbi:succinyl-diaminopimelate desuccinylase [Microbacterium oxydans]|jgi:succinyl-diaminopimelate desuccinylase|uniref:Succinyl-diaminopimelate desuccinylase n=2 Tax=Microbacterium TaxID=33882 RepID=A0A147DVC7_9MICO|nr:MULTISPECIES: succinyl-diaminopimelate desuccinylase [Microbacterium]AZS41110.1 Putative succinyl-diaminopimelate desuccinylase DapE [Microbacterium oxydans]KKX96288.1 succinyl-diaminopimelate desuccinylase [Microbacterium sp. Ag1]KTR74348.1 succinyl-diaminopimelate desuccinylase [Microbacterium oxydans]MBE7953993.1 succinyl-diaminopimelate desuccinylase [Microbacterium sp. R1]NYF27699.1 succinyl-diaminopimelate desuccinylase [Microbacterium sp. JAI119]
MVLDLTASSVDLTRAICDIPSVSGDEKTLADAIEAAVTPLGHLQVFRHGNTVIARTDLGRAQRVAIAGHIDTVPINANLPTRDIEIDGVPYLWGRGTVDMKAGTAVQLKLAAELVEPAIDITWMWYDNEEVEASKNGLGLLAAVRPDLFEADFAILGEPSNGEVEGGCNGTMRAIVRTSGVRAHSARAWIGENAIHRAAPILTRLAEYRAREVPVEGLLYRESLSAVRIAGGVAGNVIPDACEVEVNYRFAPSKSAAEAETHLRGVLAGFDVEITDAAEGARPGLDAEIAKQFVAAVGAEPRPKYGWTDVARFSALGIPAVNYGPGDPHLAHHDEERVPLAQIDAVERGLRAWLTSH